jgi:hypothetical protein
MAQNNFTATGIQNWATPSNWSLGHVPTNSEDAFIGTTGTIVVAWAANLSSRQPSVRHLPRHIARQQEEARYADSTRHGIFNPHGK